MSAVSNCPAGINDTSSYLTSLLIMLLVNFMKKDLKTPSSLLICSSDRLKSIQTERFVRLEVFTYRLDLKVEVVLLLDQHHHFLLQLLPPGLRLCELLFESRELLFHVLHLLLSLRAAQQWLYLEEEPHPGPVLHVHEGADVVLDDENRLPAERKSETVKMMKLHFQDNSLVAPQLEIPHV